MSSPPPYPPQGGYPPSSNPPPAPYPPGYQQGYPPYGRVPRVSSKVMQVTTLAILMIVQGALEAIIGLVLLVMGPAMLSTKATMPRSDQEAVGIMSAVFIILGVLILLTAGLKIVAGIKNLKYRGRTLGIAALISSIVSMMTGYCAPTAIALLIYGLIIYLNNDVRRAFEMGEQGVPPEHIKATPF
jgi:hypothetical protein